MHVRRFLAVGALIALLGTMFLAPSANAATGGLTITANNADILSLQISPTSIDFGNIRPDGTTGNYGAVVTAAGAQYCAGALTATVWSNHASWSLTVVVASSGSSNMDLSNVGSSPATGCGTLPTYPLTGASAGPLPVNTGGFVNGFVAANQDVWLNDKWTNTQGSFSASSTFTLT